MAFASRTSLYCILSPALELELSVPSRIKLSPAFEPPPSVPSSITFTDAPRLTDALIFAVVMAPSAIPSVGS